MLKETDFFFSFITGGTSNYKAQDRAEVQSVWQEKVRGLHHESRLANSVIGVSAYRIRRKIR